ncbi:MAG TPA: PadR family transcriptional regulator [Solibacterales bacterium]|nr:PadR family transcriptional regulator [Bryobacterales bacterium]
MSPPPTPPGSGLSQLSLRTAGRRCSVGALYTTLDRLQAKGFIATRFGEPNAERGGRAKRLVTVTGAGRRAAAEFYSAITRVSRGIRWEVTDALAMD